MRRSIHRFLSSTRFRLSLLLWLVTIGPLWGEDRLVVEVRETGGWSRSVYPCTLQLDRPATARRPRFRLLDEQGRPVVLQVDAEPHGKRVRWWLAFSVTLTPFQRRVFSLEVGPAVRPGPRRERGHVVKATDTMLQVINAPYLTWSIPRRVGPFLQSLEFGGHEHLRGPTARLELKDRAGRSYRLGGPQAKRWRLVRKGPLAVTLAGDSSVTPVGRAAVVSHIELDFPVSRSWSRLDWSLKDSDDEISELSLVVDLNLDPPRSGAPTLADFGAGTWVYARLAAGQVALLESSARKGAPRWRVLQGRVGNLRPLVVARPGGHESAEGWTHLMDRSRCLALAVGQFGDEQSDSIRTTAEGRVTVRRVFTKRSVTNRRPKQLRAWLHFVGFPPQQAAATSPRHMQTAPLVRIVP
ncbi:MAG: hypothetical protein VB859_11920 [Planctomycetaceae bacterium]